MLNRNLLAILAFLTALTAAFAQKSGEQVFRKDILHEVRIEFKEKDFLDSLYYYYEVGAYPNYDSKKIKYMMADISIDGNKVDSVGIRFKGFTSFIGESDKKPIKIDFNEFVKGKKLDGLRKLNLNNGFGDASIQRDYISYDLHRAMGVPAPRTAYTRVYLNGEYWGLYVMIEQVDKEFLDNNFPNDKGNLFKNQSWSSLSWKGNTQEAYDSTFNLKTNEEENDWVGFISFMNLLNNSSDEEFKAQIGKSFNVPLYLKVLAVDVATGNWDSYLEHGRNWYLYEDLESGIFHWIPWDYNFALGGIFGGFGVNDPIEVFKINQKSSEKVLIKRLLNIDEYYNMYLSFFCNMLDHHFLSEKYDTIIATNKRIIEKAYAEDTKALFSLDTFLIDIGDGKLSLRSRIKDHVQILNKDLDQLIDCPELGGPLEWQAISINELMASNDEQSGISDPQGEFEDWIELYNNTTGQIDLSNMYLSDDRSNLKKWQFPTGTKMDKDSYLIVWADKDNDPNAIHANFKLKKSGEQVYLSQEDGTIMDSVRFSQQTTNVALARIPNGKGNFLQQAPTFGSNNETNVSTKDASQNLAILAFPNPTTDVINLHWDMKNNSGQQEIKVFDILGHLVHTESLSDGKTKIDVSHWAKGSYMGTILNNNGKSVEGRFKFTVQ